MTRTFWIVFALLAVGCGAPPISPGTGGGAGVPDSTSNGSPRTTLGQLTLSGIISGTTPQGSRALDGALVNAWVQGPGGSGYSYWYAHGETIADSAGHFQLIGLPESATVQLQVAGEAYIQQCASPPVTMGGDVQLDVQLASKATLSVSPDSVPPPPPGFRSISGRILEQAAAGTQPTARAAVDFEPVIDFPAAMTVSDAAGRYLLCGVPDGKPVEVCAGSERQNTCVTVPAGQSTGIDIVLLGPGD